MSTVRSALLPAAAPSGPESAWTRLLGDADDAGLRYRHDVMVEQLRSTLRGGAFGGAVVGGAAELSVRDENLTRPIQMFDGTGAGVPPRRGDG